MVSRMQVKTRSKSEESQTEGQDHKLNFSFLEMSLSSHSL